MAISYHLLENVYIFFFIIQTKVDNKYEFKLKELLYKIRNLE